MTRRIRMTETDETLDFDCVDPQDLQEDGGTAMVDPKRHKAQPGRL
ncbi:MAG: hypothetical protein IPK89_10355 [Sphingomonadales bacterium]|nr:hypothetical protein [Sphingomonadales bacterium]